MSQEYPESSFDVSGHDTPPPSADDSLPFFLMKTASAILFVTMLLGTLVMGLMSLGMVAVASRAITTTALVIEAGVLGYALRRVMRSESYGEMITTVVIAVGASMLMIRIAMYG